LTPGRSASQPEYLVIGQVLAPRGLKGEVRVAIITDFPDRFALLDHVYLGPEHILFKLERFRRHKQWALLKFAGLDTRESVEKLRGLSVEIPIAQAMPLGQDEYYEHQLIGLEVWSTDQRLLGRVTEIIFTGSNDVYVVQGEGKELLIPALKDVVLEINLEKGRMIAQLVEGL